MTPRLPFLAALAWPGAAVAQAPPMLPETIVLAERRLAPDGRPAGIVAAWDGDELAAAAPRTLDELLARDPSFSLYRRQTALFGHPTSAGVSLRGTGATAASSSLVLLDGIPQNDPFGGWVHWARYDPIALDSLQIVPAARAAVWGNMSPAGVVQLRSLPTFDERHLLGVDAGSHRTVSGSWAWQGSNEAETLAMAARASAFRTDGFFAVGGGQRGPIDRRLDLEHHSADLRLAWRPRPGLTVESSISHFHEDRGNGTPLSRNSTEALDFSLRVTEESGPVRWQALAYHQRREFESMFSSVDAGRAGENPALDQFDVPGRGTGGALTARWEPAERWSLTVGVDGRHLTGETNEDAGFVGGRFVRRRRAGGEQTLAGVFAAAGWEADDRTRIDASARADVWWLRDGERVERSLTTGALLRRDAFRNRDGIDPSLALVLTRTLAPELEAHLSAGTSFRLPSLNELYRPFRVRDDIVEANAALDPERFHSVEAGLVWTPADSVRLAGTVFHHWIQNAIANVPVTDPAQIAALFGALPTGGSGSQRRNVDEARVLGVQGQLEWQPRESLVLTLDGIWSETEFHDSRQQPLLQGKPFPQAPDLRLIAGFSWQATPALNLSAGYEYGASQYDDALARRRIGDFTSARIGASWRTRGGTVFHARIDNLFDEEIATGLSSDGIRTIAAPRTLWLGVRREF